MADDLIETLYDIKLNEILMMKTRGYDVSHIEGLMNYDLEMFTQLYSEEAKKVGTLFRALTSVYRKESTGEQIYIFYPQPSSGQTGKSVIAELIAFLQSQPEIQNAIIISQKALSTDAKSEITNYPIYFIQHFLYSELTWNKTAHSLADPHYLFTDEEADQFLRENPQIGRNQMPNILETDPQAKYLGARDGQIVRIIRDTTFYSAQVSRSISYRLVKSERSVLGA
ncbi:RNA polymerase II RPB5 subunit [Pithovirus sibericum]|uniref:RNA polymerase II RPB5 subunit n=1 Tax=Pithovirus sibericum TaxID=1450746 RepID=W5S4C2_9VIRU|nr:RNA polymerase II RPB5 subunit [Pithovirus sibericum]AHH01598.1 RNA polymerase II RPB5 subunit [Pithovirus sibericum]WIL05161.1 RNA polymerase II RPB5 subunit [Pithovirus mammoth]